MQYEPSNEKVVAASAPHMAVSQPLPVIEDPEIRRTRKTFLIILVVLLSISIAEAIASVCLNNYLYATLNTSRGAFVTQSLCPILFYGFGILVAYRYSVTGLRVLAWIIILMLILIGVCIMIFVCFGLTALDAAISSNNNSEGKTIMTGISIFMFILIVLIVARFFFLVIVVRLAFKLARLIKNKRNIWIQSI